MNLFVIFFVLLKLCTVHSCSRTYRSTTSIQTTVISNSVSYSINVRNSEIFLNGIKIGDYQQGGFSVSSTSDEIIIVNNQRVFRIPIGAKPNTKGFTNTNFPTDDEDFIFVEGSGYQNSKHKLCY